MSEPPSARNNSSLKHKSLLERLTAFIFREPENREELLQALHDAHERDLLDADALSMIEGVLQVSELRARDLMIPRSQMDVIDISDPPERWIPFVIATAHSRFPVVEGTRDQVIGILLAKDVLRYYNDGDFDLRASLRPAVFIPESKPLNVLLRDFRVYRNHMAMVVDEYGGVAGLITIEDVLEQIVGEIEDEYDQEEGDDAIVAEADGRYRVRALTEIEQFNASFGTSLSDASFDTIGGLLTEQFGRVPKRGDALILGDLRFEVLRADARRPLMFAVTRVEKKTVVEEFATSDEQQHPA
ncbi:MAG: CBS domain-containing protein [Pseudomonadota bacterium]|nr:CBS domain-containing protein [Pseudomonadota bacterium]